MLASSRAHDSILQDLNRVITFYCRSKRTKAPLVSDAVAQLRLNRGGVEHVYTAIRKKEAAAGMRFAKTKRLKGNVEGDGHGVRKIYVSNSNPHFQKEVAEAKKKWQKGKNSKNKPFPKYWQGHVRVAGLKQRDGHGVVVRLPLKLVPPMSSPPPEGKSELVNSKLLRRLDKKKVVRLFADGAHAWPAAVKAEGLANVRNFAVSHRGLQFTKKLKLKKKAKYSNTAGTQVVDRWWESLDEYIPKQLHSKTGKGGTINEALFDYVFSFVWRCSLSDNADFKAEVGKVCAL
jgi:L-rhamnose mutarotase